MRRRKVHDASSSTPASLVLGCWPRTKRPTDRYHPVGFAIKVN